MKKSQFILVAFIFMFLFRPTVHAQKGSWYVGGQLGYNSKTEKNTGLPDVKTNTWAVAPEVGTFLQNTLQLGFAVNLSGSDVSDGIDSTTTKFAPVLYLRRFFKVGDAFSTFVGLVGSVTTGSVDANATKYDLGGWSANVSLGAAYAVSKRFTVVGQYGLFGYTSQTVESGPNKNEINNLGFNINALGPVFNVGLYWTFKP